MDVYLEDTKIDDVKIISHQVFKDERGFFQEVFRHDLFQQAGLPHEFVQLNHSRSSQGVARGLHFQWEPPMGKLMRVTLGSAFLVAVDIRKDSPSIGQHVAVTLNANDHKQIWAPAGFARGFCTLSDDAEIQYLCTGEYNSQAESGILWNDPEIGIDWPFENPILSAKDEHAQSLSQWLDSPDSANFTF
jgi:dTDP-4-dehydrorhamnose 3,5-epimerase